MGWDIDVIGEIDVNEPIVGINSGKGSLLMIPQMLGSPRLPDIKEYPEQMMIVLRKVIAELDKGNNGVFNDAFGVECIKGWSSREWEKIESDWDVFKRLNYAGCKTIEQYAGHTYRSKQRETAVRFWLYLKAGFTIKMEW